MYAHIKVVRKYKIYQLRACAANKIIGYLGKNCNDTKQQLVCGKLKNLLRSFNNIKPP